MRFTSKEQKIARRLYNSLRSRKMRQTGGKIAPWKRALPSIQTDWLMLARVAMREVAKVTS